MGDTNKKALNDLIEKRDVLRKQEKEMTAKIKSLRRDISKQKQKPKGNVQSQPLVAETRHKLIALRLSCRNALRKAGYKNNEISEIMGVSYGALREQECRLIREARYLEKKAFQNDTHNDID